MDGGVIYDFGMNNGDDVGYYLLKGCKVVGVDANPSLCRAVEQRFADEIRDGSLVVLNVALSTDDAGRSVGFYIHKSDHVLSQLDVPDAASMADFERIEVPSRRASDVIGEHGEPRYVKIDLEGLDAKVLREVFKAGIRPPEVSAESHSVDVFACLVEAGYKAFSLVDGETVSEKYRDTSIETPGRQQRFSFRAHSAGPFGVDIRSEWQDADSFFYLLSAAGLGWKDIHASDLIEPGPPLSFGRRIAWQTVALAKNFVRGLAGRFAG